MRRLLALLCLVPACAFGQAASDTERSTVLEIAQCIVQNAPEGWSLLTMVVRLDKPGDDTGQVRYFATRDAAPDQPLPYTPCDASKPARTLLGLRKDQAEDKRGWIGARLLLHRNGKFSLNYDYP